MKVRHVVSDARGQALILVVGLLFLLTVGTAVLASYGQVFLSKGRHQRAADLAAMSAARTMQDNFSRLFAPARDSEGLPDPDHLEVDQYVELARRAAIEYASKNGVRITRADVTFPDAKSFAPVRVRVRVHERARLKMPLGESGEAAQVPVKAGAEAEIGPGDGNAWGQPPTASGGGYDGPLVYRQGKPMRPDVARAFDRMSAAARQAGVSLLVNSGYRSDAEQARLFRAHPDPKWVAPPGKSLHRLATELDLGPSAAYSWLATNAGRYGFVQRYSWEPWHYGYKYNARSTPDVYRGAGRPKGLGGDGESALPSFVPARYAAAISEAARRYNVSASLLSAQLYAESNFNPFSTSPKGAQGIAQFMPQTARAYRLRNPFDAKASINAQARLMRELLQRFASVELALAAYNAGPDPVARCGCVPDYPETKEYVAKILGLMGGAGEIPLPAQGELEVRLVT